MAVPFLVALLSAAGRDLDGRTSWLTCRPMIFAGEASFALYLVHELVIVNLLPYVHAAPWLNAVTMTAVAFIAAGLLHLVVERPMNRMLRGGARSVAHAVPGQERTDPEEQQTSSR
jgi:peptidoglycan/LPS O-acetylase OafA/YrhL